MKLTVSYSLRLGHNAYCRSHIWQYLLLDLGNELEIECKVRGTHWRAISQSKFFKPCVSELLNSPPGCSSLPFLTLFNNSKHVTGCCRNQLQFICTASLHYYVSLYIALTVFQNQYFKNIPLKYHHHHHQNHHRHRNVIVVVIIIIIIIIIIFNHLPHNKISMYSKNTLIGRGELKNNQAYSRGHFSR